ncbi:MAG: MFS transporter [Ferruginibacter sp.]|nr:MFS transporter [Ferruginibacter sp.]
MKKDIELKRGWILAALMLTMMLAAMDSTIVSTAIPQIVGDLGGFTKFSWVFSIYLLAQVVTIPIYGKLADIFGRKKVLIFGIIIFLLGSVACAFSWNISSLIIFRGIQGLGAGSIMATVNTIAGDIYSVEERAKIQGYLSSMWGISAIIGPAIGGALAEYISWHWIFLINIPIGILSVFFLFKYFKEEVSSQNPVIDYKGALLMLLLLSLLFIYLLESGQSWAWLSPIGIVLPLMIVLLGIWTYWVEKKAKEPIMPLSVWKNKTLAFTNLAMAGMGIVMMGPETFLPTFAQASLGYGPIISGFILASMSIGWPVASALSGKIYLRIGFRETSLLGAFLVLFACIGFLVIPHPQPIELLITDQVLIGAGFGFLSTPALVGIQSMVPWQQRGVVTSSNIFARNLGQSLGATIVGAIFNNSFLQQMHHAPSGFTLSTKDIMSTLHDKTLSLDITTFVKNTINHSMHNVYWGLLIFTLIIIYFLYHVPHRSPKDHSFIDL